MSIDQAEQLKRELTDKWVIVTEGIPELRRFASLTGKVRTVNMNCRALVEFDGPEDIGWYDIDPQFLTIVDGPRPKAKQEEKTKPAAKSAEAKPAAAPAAGGNPLDAIRAGGAAKAAAPAAGGSPLDAIRAGGAAKAAPAPEKEEAEKPAEAKKEEPKPAAGGSPLDQIRASGAFKG